MNPRRAASTLFAILAIAALACFLSTGRAAAQADPAADTEEYTPVFARVRFVEGAPRVLRADGATEELFVNAPVYAGDRIQTDEGQRIEVQLPDGSLVRLNLRTTVDFYSFADGQAPGGAMATVLALSRGSVKLAAADPPPNGEFRIDTPSASVYTIQASAFRVDVESNDAVRASVELGSVEVSGAQGSVVVGAGRRTRVFPGSAPRAPWAYDVAMQDSFDSWVVARDESYRAREAPGPEYESLPEPVQPYYAELSNNGRWVWDDEYGWVWQPTSVEPDWRPYAYGNWSYGPYGAVWVGAEPWGWPVYRYGRWCWSGSIGWCWAPGWVFSPAWVYWYYGPSYVGWCPLGYWDYPVWVGGYWGWGYPWYWGSPWNFVYYDHFYCHNIHNYYVPRDHVTGRHLEDGVVGRHYAGGRPVEGTPTGRSADRVRGISPDTYQKARDMADKRVADRKLSHVRDAKPVQPRDRNTPPSTGDRPFRDRERNAFRDRARTPDRPAGQAGRPNDQGRRTSPGTPSARPPSGGRSGRPESGVAPRRDGGASGRSPMPRRMSGESQRKDPDSITPRGVERGSMTNRVTSPAGDATGTPSNRPSDRMSSFPRGESRGTANRAPAAGAQGARRSSGSPAASSNDAGSESVRRFLSRIAEDDRQAPRTSDNSRRSPAASSGAAGQPARETPATPARETPPARSGASGSPRRDAPGSASGGSSGSTQRQPPAAPRPSSPSSSQGKGGSSRPSSKSPAANTTTRSGADRNAYARRPEAASAPQSYATGVRPQSNRVGPSRAISAPRSGAPSAQRYPAAPSASGSPAARGSAMRGQPAARPSTAQIQRTAPAPAPQRSYSAPASRPSAPAGRSTPSRAPSGGGASSRGGAGASRGGGGGGHRGR